MWYEERMNKRISKTKNPMFSLCCGNGKVQLPRLEEPPPFLKRLLEFNGDPRGPKFRETIRAYNSNLALSSSGGKIDNSVNNGGGPYVFRINGQNHHMIGSLMPCDGKPPKFAQLYICDTDNEVNNRLRAMKNNDRLDPEILTGLIHMLDECNPLVQFLRMIRDRFRESDFIPVRMKLIGTRSKDGRQYNLPTASEVAALVVDGDEDSYCNRDIIIEQKDGRLRRISELHPLYMALQYPLLFPRAESGYTTDLRTRCGKKKLSQREFYCYRMMYREGEGHTILLGGRLMQQFFADCWTTIRSERISWCVRNQNKLRFDVLHGLEDSVLRGDTDPGSVGTRIILPSSFTGGPRYMAQCYQDSMAICRWAGPPELFLTFTCNPKWPEIKEFLKKFPGQRPEERPDLVDRVFKIKLDQLIHDLTKGKHFGKTRGGNKFDSSFIVFNNVSLLSQPVNNLDIIYYSCLHSGIPKKRFASRSHSTVPR